MTFVITTINKKLVSKQNRRDGEGRTHFYSLTTYKACEECSCVGLTSINKIVNFSVQVLRKDNAETTKNAITVLTYNTVFYVKHCEFLNSNST